MRITRIQLVGLAAALAGVGAKDAEAGNVNITTATTTPLSTSAPAAPGDLTPGDVTIAAGGSITVTAGQTAVTVNSSNNVSNAGTLASTDAINTTAISILGGNVGPNTITNSGAINLLETYVLADTDSDGDFDGAFATGTNRHGIFLQAGPTFTGDIINSGSISVEGQNSFGVRLDALLTGDLNSSGTISVVGENSIGIAINGGAAGGVTGDVLARGGVSMRGQNSTGMLVGAPIGGELRINGAWVVSGFHNTARPANTANLEPLDDLLIGGPAIAIHHSVGGGVTIEGIGVEDDVDDDGDGLLDGAVTETDDDLSASISVFGSAPALLIQADPLANLVLGPIALGTGAGYGLHVRGAVAASGVYDGISATAIRIEGDSGGSLTTTANGAAIDGVVSATAFEADAYGVYVGDNAVVPTLLVRRSVTSAVSSQAANNAYAVYFASGASVPALNNIGVLRSQYFGETGNAVAITDLSNSLATITNSGTIQAQLIATDDDLTDNIPPPPITGSAIAIDVSASNIGVTLNQLAEVNNLLVDLDDDDGVDDDIAIRPAVLIEGDIRFGSGADTVNLLRGSIVGALSFGAGADTFIINNGATYAGRLTDDAAGLLTIDVIDGGLSLAAGATQISSAHFGADSDFGIALSATGPSTFLQASGAVTFDVGARIVPVVPNGLPDSDSNVVFLTALGGLSVDSGSLGAITGTGVPFIYNVNIGLVLGDPNSLEASYVLKSPTALGLNTNQAIAFNNIIDAIQTDAAASAAMASLDSALDFADAYEDLMPSYASGAAELAATAIQQAQSATTNRLAATRLHDVDEVSAWAQEIGYGLERTPPTVNGQEFKGQGFGIAMGIDGPLDNGGLFGLSASFVASEVSEPGRPEGEISAWFGQANAYLGAALGPVDLDFIAGGGVGKMQSRRFVEIGAFNALSQAEWWAFEGHGSARASVPMRLADWFVITPQAALTYVALSESAYTEEGGGALDYDVDSALSQRLWGDAGVEFSTRFNLAGGTSLAPRVFAGYRTNLIDEQAERTVRFAAGGTDFTLTDEGFGDGAPLVGIGIDATNGYSTFSLSYEGEYGDQIDRHSVNAAIRFRF